MTSTRENDTYGHIDKHGRYRANMLLTGRAGKPGSRAVGPASRGRMPETPTVSHLPLLAGTEVAIGFEDGNPDRPYIAGVLHDSAHGDHVTIRNDKRNVLRTRPATKSASTTSAEKSISRSRTEYGGKSQLNLGHLVDSDSSRAAKSLS